MFNSPCSNTAQSNVKVVRKKEVINNYLTKGLDCLTNSHLVTIENVWRTVWRIYKLILGFNT